MDEELQKLVDKAILLARQGNPDEAISMLTDLISRAPRSGQKSKLYDLRGLVHFLQKGEYDRAISDFSEAIRQNPKNADAFNNRGFACLEKGASAQAIADFSKAIDLGLDSMGLYVNRATAYSSIGEHDRAISDYNQAEKLDPKNPSVYCNRGTAYAQKGEYGQAITDFKEALQLDPDDALTYVNLGNVYEERGEHDKALENYDRVIASKPNYVLAYINKATVYYKKGEPDKELAVYDAAISQATRPIQDSAYALIYHRRALIYAGKNKYDKAIDDCSEAINLNSEYAEAYNSRGSAHYYYCYFAYLRGDSRIAEQHFKKAKADFEEAEARGEMLLSTSVPKYMINEMEDFNHEEKRGIFELHHKVSSIRENLFLGQVSVSHYCSLETLKNLAEDSPTEKNNFRLYNVDYMDDPEEGKTLLEILTSYSTKKDFNVEQAFYKNDKENKPASPAYIGSFSQRDETLFMWRTYGKQNGSEAAGACLIFKSCAFSSRLSPVLGAKSSGALYLRKLYRGFPLSVPKISEARPSVSEIVNESSSVRSHLEPDLFKVVYEGVLDEELPELKGLLEKLSQVLEGLEEKVSTHKLAREILDEIRFLFKLDHYKEEKEARVILIRHLEDEGADKYIKIDRDEFPPKFYVEPFIGGVLKEIILGPQVKRGISEWGEIVRRSKFLKDVKWGGKSKIKYGAK